MADALSPEQRHKCMVANKSRDTKPEILVRKWLWNEGFRYRVNVRSLPGSPDIVIGRLKVVIFINGCFWHGHNTVPTELLESWNGGAVFDLEDSACCHIPQSNRTYWLRKINRNKTRDRKDHYFLKREGWTVMVIWECMLRTKNREDTLKSLSLRLHQIEIEKAVKNEYKESENWSEKEKTIPLPKPYDTDNEQELMVAESNYSDEEPRFGLEYE